MKPVLYDPFTGVRCNAGVMKWFVLGSTGLLGSRGGDVVGSQPVSDGGASVGPPGDAVGIASVDRCITLTMAPFEVAAGSEAYMCQQFANPFGKDVDIVSADGRASPASRFSAFSMPPDTGRSRASPLQSCVGFGLEFHPTVYMSQRQHRTVAYPRPDMGYPVPAANGLMLDVHSLNTASTALAGSASVTLCWAKPGVVTTRVGTIDLIQTLISVPPTPMSNPATVSKTWTPSAGAVPASYFIYSSWSFMTARSLDIQATANGHVFYDDTLAASPPLQLHNPPLAMTGSQSLRWTCKIYNDTDATLSFGDSVVSNAWCEYIAGYYPVADPRNPDVIFVGP